MGCLPVTTKCCFCAPLGPGLLAWAYIKLGVTVLASVPTVEMIWYSEYNYVALVNMLISFSEPIFIGVFAVVFSVIFIAGLHKKNYKMICVYYWFSILEVLITLGLLAWQIYEAKGIPSRRWDHYWTAAVPSTFARLVIRVITDILLPTYFIVVIRSELLAIKGEREQPAETTNDDTVLHTVIHPPVVQNQDRRYYFVYSEPELEQKVNNARHIFPVEELRIERLRQELE